MAGIDKIYGTQAQYIELKNWLNENEIPIKCRTGYTYIDDIGKDVYQKVLPSDYLYEENGYNNDYRPISNFPKAVDKWLMKVCPLPFVIERLKEQYPE